MQMVWQTVQTLIRLLLWEQSDLGLHCLLRPRCPNVKIFYDILCTNRFFHKCIPGDDCLVCADVFSCATGAGNAEN